MDETLHETLPWHSIFPLCQEPLDLLKSIEWRNIKPADERTARNPK